MVTKSRALSRPAGVFNWGLQAMLFTLLLFALLSADTDPLTYTIRVLPLTDTARLQACPHRPAFMSLRGSE